MPPFFIHSDRLKADPRFENLGHSEASGWTEARDMTTGEIGYVHDGVALPEGYSRTPPYLKRGERKSLGLTA